MLSFDSVHVFVVAVLFCFGISNYAESRHSLFCPTPWPYNGPSLLTSKESIPKEERFFSILVLSLIFKSYDVWSSQGLEPSRLL